MAIDPVMQDLNRELAADEAAELRGYAVDQVLARFGKDRRKVAEALDDYAATAGHVPEGATLLSWLLAAFVQTESDRDATALVCMLRDIVRDQLRDEAEELVRANDARIEAEGGEVTR